MYEINNRRINNDRRIKVPGTKRTRDDIRSCVLLP